MIRALHVAAMAFLALALWLALRASERGQQPLGDLRAACHPWPLPCGERWSV